MMSILLFTFESALHCQPGVIDSVSLLPVANVVESLVTKDPFAVDRKSRSNPAAVKPAGNGDLVVPAAVNRLSQSSVCVLPPTLVVVLALTSPSSWNAMSCTASALPAVNSATAAASRSGKKRTWKRRLRLLPVSPRIRSAIVEPPHSGSWPPHPGGEKRIGALSAAANHPIASADERPHSRAPPYDAREVVHKAAFAPGGPS